VIVAAINSQGSSEPTFENIGMWRMHTPVSTPYVIIAVSSVQWGPEKYDIQYCCIKLVM